MTAPQSPYQPSPEEIKKLDKWQAEVGQALSALSSSIRSSQMDQPQTQRGKSPK